MKTLSACIIVKNEIENIASLISDLSQFCEEVVVVDTGSTDGTYQLLYQIAETNPKLKVDYFQWVKDFAAARNYSFSLATQDAIFWCDADDRIPAETISKLNELKEIIPDYSILSVPYNYGPNTITHNYRILCRECEPRWVGRIHEGIVYDGPINQVINLDPNEYIIDHHRKSLDNSRNRNIDIFFEMIKDLNYEMTSRDWAYYGMEVYNQSMCEEGVQIWLPHLTEMNIGDVSYVLQNIYTYLRDYKQLERFYHIIKDYEAKGNKFRSDILTIIAATCLDLGKIDEGIQYCRYAFNEDRYNEDVDQFDRSDWYFNGLGNFSYGELLNKKGTEPDKAIYHYQKAVEAYPDIFKFNE